MPFPLNLALKIRGTTGGYEPFPRSLFNCFPLPLLALKRGLWKNLPMFTTFLWCDPSGSCGISSLRALHFFVILSCRRRISPAFRVNSVRQSLLPPPRLLRLTKSASQRQRGGVIASEAWQSLVFVI